ncbi:MAG TPA: glutamine amidotransferase [Xanthobacteraceae bacterium]|nr:glutamine amidotransferase [Xanthobacteraceae bacterium]
MIRKKICLAVRHVAFEDLGLFGPLVVSRNYEVRYHDAGIDPFDSDTLQSPDLVIVLGGPIGVYEGNTYPFIAHEVAAIADRIAADKPILGICLGAQMMAAALGARVAPGPVKEIGWAPLTLTAEGNKSVLAPLGITPVLHWHGDNCELPANCSVLASTANCPVQAFIRSPSQLALQFHLETDPVRFESWLVGHTVELGKAGIDPNELRKQAQTFGQATLEVGRKVLATWLDRVAGAPV